MTKPLQLALFAFEGVQILDITGPAAVFSAANTAIGRDMYRIHIVSAHGGAIVSNCGVSLHTVAISDLTASGLDMLLLAGGNRQQLLGLATNSAVCDWLRQASEYAPRYGSVCSGALLLGKLGLLDGKRVTTHWNASAELTRLAPRCSVDAQALYIQDGRLWTSAGVTTGIDMCLAMVEQDLGTTVSQTIAKHLVIYARRPGYQAQFSPLLSAQAHAGSQFSALIGWMHEHLQHTLDIPLLAARMAMSERSFHRKFTAAIGETPAHFVETLRLDHARHLLAGSMSLKEIAVRTGFSTPAHFTRAFERRFGITASLFRELHLNGDAATSADS